MKYELLTAKRWAKTHLKYPIAANVISLCRWAENPDKVEALGNRRPTCALCQKLMPFVQFSLGDITREVADKLLRRFK